MNGFVRFRTSLLLCALALSLLVAVPASASPISVKVLVITTFEVGKNADDEAGEFQYWYEAYFQHARSFDVKGLSSPLYLNDDGVAGIVTGSGKARAAASLMAVLKDPRLDFSKTYFIASGCAGTSPIRGTLGDVFICDWVIDYEIGFRWKESDAEPDEPSFMISDYYKENAAIQLNLNLVRWALFLSRDAILADSPEAAEYRMLYPQEFAHGRPAVRTGTSVTADGYWLGKGSSEQAEKLCERYGTSYYGVAQMEDIAFAVVLRAMGCLDRYLVVRDVVDFDQPHQNQTVRESIDAQNGAFGIGMINGYRVGTTVIRRILRDWAQWEKGVPPLPDEYLRILNDLF